MIRKPAVLLLAALSTTAAIAHEDDAKAGTQQLGKVNFPNSCSPAVQPKLRRGVAMLHSFWYSAGEQAFREVLAEDPRCAIADVGHRLDPDDQSARRHRRRRRRRRQRAQAAIDKGREIGREDAARARLHRGGRRLLRGLRQPPRARSASCSRAKAYEALAARYPDDDEAQIFYALYLAGTQSQADQTYAAYLKAAAILEEQFAKYPGPSRASRTT